MILTEFTLDFFLGRFHPLILHLPIGLLTALLVIEAVHLREHSPTSLKLGRLLAVLTAFSAIAAALTGHSPAGGTILAIFCDYRIAAKGAFRMGLNEVQVGLPLPGPFFSAYELVVGHRNAERLAVQGALVDPGELDGNYLVYLPWYVDANDSDALQTGDEILRERFWAALKRMHPHLDDADLVAFKVSRARHVMALSTLGYSQSLAPRDTSLPGVHIVNSAMICNGTLNVNETVGIAETAAAELAPMPGLRMGAAAKVV